MRHGCFRPAGASRNRLACAHTGRATWLRALVPALLSVGLCGPVGAGMVIRQAVVAAPETQAPELQTPTIPMLAMPAAKPADGKPQAGARPTAPTRSASPASWPPCIRLLNESALAPALMPRQRQVLLEHCAS